jgi:hypothetical protein
MYIHTYAHNINIKTMATYPPISWIDTFIEAILYQIIEESEKLK